MNPYEVTTIQSEGGIGYFSFTTASSIEYTITFDQGDFTDNEKLNNQILEFGFFPKEESLSAEKQDPRIKITLLSFIDSFFENNKDSIVVYIAFNGDGRQEARCRLFESWTIDLNHNIIYEKFELSDDDIGGFIYLENCSIIDEVKASME